MAEVNRVYKGTCGGCDQRLNWLLVGSDDDLTAVPPAHITITHLCQQPTREVVLVYEGEQGSRQRRRHRASSKS
jgi:hypothetical protein